MLLGKQTKTRSETANQGLEKSRESVGRSPPISVLIFVYASVGKKKSSLDILVMSPICRQL